MKVMLIFPDMNSFHSIKYHPGLASISSYLKSFGHEVKLEYVTSVDQFDRVVDHIINFGAEIVAFTSVESQFVYVEDLSIQIKKNHNCIIICGGPYVTLFPEVIKSADGLDGIFVGEGEYAFLELIENLQKKQDYLTTHNFCYYDEKSDKVVKNPLNPLIDNLETKGLYLRKGVVLSCLLLRSTLDLLFFWQFFFQQLSIFQSFLSLV